jgi:hypothetical protein
MAAAWLARRERLVAPANINGGWVGKLGAGRTGNFVQLAIAITADLHVLPSYGELRAIDVAGAIDLHVLPRAPSSIALPQCRS